MKLIKGLKLVGMMCAMAFFAGCGKGPEDALTQWIDAIAEGNADAAIALTVDDQSAQQGVRMLAGLMSMASDEKKEEFRQTFKEKQAASTVAVEGDKAYFVEDGKRVLFAVKQGGEWKITGEK